MRYGQGNIVIYTIDLEKDLIEKITFSTEACQEVESELKFVYLQETEKISDEFVEPSYLRYRKQDEESKGFYG